MSKLEQMIQESCSRGVREVRLKDVCSIERGKRVVKKDLLESGLYPVFQNSLTPMGYYSASNYPKNTPFIIVGGAAGEIGYSFQDFWAADDCVCILSNGSMDNRFVYHCLKQKESYIKSNVRKASIPRLSRSVIEELVIPCLPLSVQREIVRILDDYTALTAKLTAELNAELAARKKQYEYYRDKLLSFETRGG